MALIWNPTWPAIKDDWTSADGVTEQDFNDIADTVVDAQEAMDYLASYVDQEVALIDLQNLKNIYLTAAGTNDYTIVAPGVDSYETGMMYNLKVTNANTGAVTLNFNSLGAKSLLKDVVTPVSSGDIVDGATVQAVYDGTNFQWINVSLSKNYVRRQFAIKSLGGL
jgi:hypothetical protein